MAKNKDNNTNESPSKGKRGRPRKSEVLEEENSTTNLDEEFSDNLNNNNNNSNPVDIKLLEQDNNNVYVESHDVIDESESLTKSNKPVSEDEQFALPKEDVNFEQDVAIENSSQDLADINDDIPENDFDPLQTAVKERGYTTGKIGEDKSITPEVEAENLKKIEEKIPEPDIKNPSYDNIPPNEKKKNTGGGGNKNDGGSGGGGNNNNGGGKTDSEFEGFETPKEDKDKKETANPKLDDLSPAQKRKAAEKTADAILLTYQKFVPKPFKALSSFNMRKLQIMEMKNELSLDIQVFDDGTTVKDYCKGVNKQVEETFVITDEMKQEAKDPLVDLLLENNLALTPAQRLLMVVGGHVVQMGVTAIQFMNQNKNALSEFKRFHQESMEVKKAAIYEAEKRFDNGNNSNNRKNDDDNGEDTVNTNTKKTPPPPPPKNEVKNEPVTETENDDIPESDANEDVPNFEEETTSDTDDNTNTAPEKEDDAANIIDEKIDVKEKDPSIDDYILTEENGGITVEIEENKQDDIEDF